MQGKWKSKGMMVLFATGISIACAATLWPFVDAMLWGAILAISFERLVKRLDVKLGGRVKAAAAVCALLAVAVGLPLGCASVQAAGQLAAAIEWGKQVAAAPWPAAPDWFDKVPVVGGWLESSWDALGGDGSGRLAEWAKAHAGEAASYLATVAGGAGSALITGLLSLCFAAVFMGKGDKIGRELADAAHQAFGEGADEWLDLGCAGIRGVAVGVCGTALVLSLAVAAGLGLAGVPAVSLLSCVAMALCLAQIGPLPILGPAGLYLALQGRFGEAIGIAALAVMLSVIDGIMRPWLIGREVRMPMVLIFAGVVGGLLSMGLMGLFAGPVALSMGKKLWDAWRRPAEAY
jgi:predicted PurR-regulated permease PerM